MRRCEVTVPLPGVGGRTASPARFHARQSRSCLPHSQHRQTEEPSRGMGGATHALSRCWNGRSSRWPQVRPLAGRSQIGLGLDTTGSMARPGIFSQMSFLLDVRCGDQPSLAAAGLKQIPAAASWWGARESAPARSHRSSWGYQSTWQSLAVAVGRHRGRAPAFSSTARSSGGHGRVPGDGLRSVDGALRGGDLAVGVERSV